MEPSILFSFSLQATTLVEGWANHCRPATTRVQSFCSPKGLEAAAHRVKKSFVSADFACASSGSQCISVLRIRMLPACQIDLKSLFVLPCSSLWGTKNANTVRGKQTNCDAKLQTWHPKPPKSSIPTRRGIGMPKSNLRERDREREREKRECMRVPWAEALVGVTPGHAPFLETLLTSSKILNVQQRGYQPRAGHIQPVKEAMIHVFLCSCIVLTSLCCFVHTRRFGLLLHTGMGTVRKPPFFRQ